YPLPESFYKDPKAFGEKPVGNGPYKFKSWKHNADIVLEKNPDYNGNFKAKNDGLDFKIYTSADSSYADVQSGNLDVSANIPPSALKSFQKNTKMNNYSKAGSGTATFTIPQSLEHFGGEEGVLRRQAISMAIDRKQITEKVLNNTATPAKEFSSPMTSGYSDSLKGNENLTFDAAKAKELWAKADAISKFTGTFTIAYNTDGGTKPIYDAVVNQLKNNLGIDAATNPVATFQEFRAAITDRTMKSAFRTGWQADYPSIENYLKPIFSSSAADGKGSNDGDYKNPAFDKLLDEAAKASDLDAANKLYQQAEEILLNDLPAIPLYNSNANAVFGKSVKNVEPNWKGVPVFYEITKE
ncbi:MAG: ABC transporter substrate-binding protein, partial [Bifidobacterium scardovii]|nr:ABC transporter substrate-binding protein [Bifidobacterium scardovii]